MSRRKVYLEDIPLDEAWRRFISALQRAETWKPLSGEDVAIEDALGRVTADAVWAALSSPGYHACAMDGYAVQSSCTYGATETSPIRLKIAADGPAWYVDTGDPLPAWADAVIMIENTQPVGEEAIEIRSSVAPWTSVRAMGEDMVATELILPANRVLSAVDLGAIAGCGNGVVTVRKKPRVAIIPTGTELVTVEQAAQRGLRTGDIIEYNSLVLSAQVLSWGGEPTRHSIVPDDYGLILRTVREAAVVSDLVLIIAGSSAGSEDYTAQIVEEAGELLVHGVALKPGHPVVLGMIDTAKSEAYGKSSSRVPIIGVPGYPVSCALTGEIFVEPLLSRWLGISPRQKPKLKATVTRKLLSSMGSDEWVRVTVGKVGERTVAAPLSRGAGVITSLVRADGIVRIPRFSEGLDAGQEVTVELYRDPEEIERTVVHIGSHDLCLDILAELLAESSRRLVSANAGSLGGLAALRRAEAHLAGSHLLDPKTGEYNISYIHQYLPDLSVVLVSFVQREQGLIVAKGNPKGIKGLEDLTRDDVRYVNRQKGAGTRVLLDYRLDQLAITPDRISGYEREEYTHLAVAVAVQSGVADCGLGIAAAADSLDLDFIPLEQEKYDLIIPRIHFDSELLRPLFDVIRGSEFKRAVSRMPGYDTTHTGEIRTVGDD
jgi:putative molybdopterin biosynthesis protein